MADRIQRFDELYARNIDPWHFRTSAYERAKYHATIAALPRAHYGLCIEAGCSIGELTRLLAARCEHVIGIDVSHVAIAEAARRHADLRHVTFRQGELPAAWPRVPAELIVLSEVLYFLSAQEIAALARNIAATWLQGDCVLVNFLGPTSEALQGAEAAACFLAHMPEAHHSLSLQHELYQLDVLSRL